MAEAPKSVNTSPAPPPPVSGSGTSGSLSYNVTVQHPRGDGWLYDATTPPSSANQFSTYTWNQATTAFLGGCGGASGYTDGDGHHIPAPGTYADPATMETAHNAMTAIAGMLQNYAQSVQEAAKTVTGTSWQGPAADAFTKTVDAFATYLDKLAKPIENFVQSGETLHSAAQRLGLAASAAGVIWTGASISDSSGNVGHDRSAHVTLTGDFTFTGKMIDAGVYLLTDLDNAYKRILE